MLTLYRRHKTACIKGYPQNQRIFYPATNAHRKLDCDCPIAAEGMLGQRYLTNRSMRTASWEEALALCDQWAGWGGTEPPQEIDSENPTAGYAVDSFLASIGTAGRNIETRSQRQYKVLLEQRLLPWYELRGYECLREFDSLDVTTKFVESWVNLNPTRGRKDAAPPNEPVSLADSTKKATLELFRIFLEYARERGWLVHNQAKKIKFRSRTAAKFGMEPHEERWFWEEVEQFTDGHYRTGQVNAVRLRAFCLAMRHGGMRISDAVRLNDTQLVPRASGNGWALKFWQKKTGDWAYVPIPNFLEQQLHKLPFLGEKDGRRYWFWTGRGELGTAENNAYMRVMKIVRRVEIKHGNFTHPVTPHTFRHTFSIRHLNAGADVKQVSRWLGHKSVSITEKHYAHAIHGTMLASDDAYDASLRRQQEQAAREQRVKFELIK